MSSMKPLWKGLSKWNILLRIGLIALALIPLIFYEDFATHAYGHLTGSVVDSMIRGQWHVVFLNTVVFISFLIPLTFRRKANWSEYGIVVAFFVSLFIEMYGIPLTVLFTAKYLAPSTPTHLRSVFHLDLLGVDFHFTVPMVYGTILMIIGTIVIIWGWATLYRVVKEKKVALATNGIYSISRNPQYLGFILIILGWLAGWPTILTVTFSVVLIIFYIRLCKKEEGEISSKDGFDEYRKKVPLLF